MLLSNKEIELMTLQQRREYYEKLRDYCCNMKNHQLCIGQDLIKNVYPKMRSYDFIFEGEENIPNDTNVIFLANHSNSHDIFTAYEILSAFKRKGSVMVATDCLSPLTTQIFNISNATLLDRRNKQSSQNSILELSHKIINGVDGVIFGESTWNLHPTKLMHNIKTGISSISLITKRPIIPTIFEYIEEDGVFQKESQLYKKCIIRFGKPIMIDEEKSLFDQTNNLKLEEEKIRKQIWLDYNTNRETLNDVDINMYLNHTYLKKFKAFGFKYDSKKEQEFLLFLNSENKENEYSIDNEGNFAPGITEMNSTITRKLFLK